MICGVFLCLLIMVKEEWKVVKGFEDYEISNLGRIKSLKFDKEKILNPGKNISGYNMVSLSFNNNKKTISVHQLVAITFLNHTPCGYKLVIDHIDNDKSNNKVENLQIVTHRFNTYKIQGKYSSKYKGVYWDKLKNKWCVNISIKGNLKHIGYFDNELEASEAYQDKIKTL